MRFSPSRTGAAAAVMAAAVTAVILPALIPGCGPGAPEVDKSAEYTPESLAQELAFRYRGLSPEAKKAPTRARARSKPAKTVDELESEERSQTKGGAKAAPTTKKRTGPSTIDDLLDDVRVKLDKIKGTTRAEAARQVSEAISKDSSLDEGDRKLLSGKMKELGEGS